MIGTLHRSSGPSAASRLHRANVSGSSCVSPAFCCSGNSHVLHSGYRPTGERGWLPRVCWALNGYSPRQVELEPVNPLLAFGTDEFTFSMSVGVQPAKPHVLRTFCCQPAATTLVLKQLAYSD